MIKNIFLTITCFIISVSVVISPAFAVSPTQIERHTTPKPTASSDISLNEKLNNQINELKERIASRVAELNLVEKRGTTGIVNETSDNKITFTDMKGSTRIIDVDEITKFSSPSAKSFGISDLTKGAKISVLGLYNKQSKQILARFIETFTTPIFLSGRISGVDKKNFRITIISENQKETVIDVETFTLISNYIKDEGMSKYGFSKITIGDRVMVTGYLNKKEPDILVSSRILVLPQAPQDPKIIIPEPTTEDSTTSSNSGKAKNTN